MGVIIRSPLYSVMLTRIDPDRSDLGLKKTFSSYPTMVAEHDDRGANKREGWQLGQWLVGLRRITSAGTYTPEIDGIRFIAIFSVIIYHIAGDILRHSPTGYYAACAGPVFWATQHGNFGVQLFFVLSGFVLSLPFAKNILSDSPGISLKRYFLRRLTRLEPLYFSALLLFFFLKTIGGRGDMSSLLPHLLASMLYLHNLIYSRPSDIDFVAWSLEIEAQFYILAPFLAAIIFSIRDKLKRRIVLAIVIVAWARLAAAAPESPRVGLSLFGQLPYFLSGFMLADFYALDPPKKHGLILWDLVGFGAGSLIIVWLANPSSTFYLGPLTVFVSYYAAFYGIWIRRFLSLKVVSTIGGMCYTIYLFHNYIIALCGFYSEKIGASLPFTYRLVVQLAIMTPVILSVSTVLFLLIERPSMQPDWPRRLKLWFETMVKSRAFA
jgi:peptidoglycan/LPS O-acetylase OafA/YrhL